jgi:hypothetical protein
MGFAMTRGLPDAQHGSYQQPFGLSWQAGENKASFFLAILSDRTKPQAILRASPGTLALLDNSQLESSGAYLAIHRHCINVPIAAKDRPRFLEYLTRITPVHFRDSVRSSNIGTLDHIDSFLMGPPYK